ncbi:MAG: hypothetical protein ABFD07_01545 [Methanobacterium sp.]
MTDEDLELENEEEGEELELRMGPDGVLHLKEELPKAIIEFKTDDELIHFLALLQQKLGPEYEPDGFQIRIENVQDEDLFMEKMTEKLKGGHEDN